VWRTAQDSLQLAQAQQATGAKGRASGAPLFRGELADWPLLRAANVMQRGQDMDEITSHIVKKQFARPLLPPFAALSPRAWLHPNRNL
jgi:hypothetical protein